MSVKRVLEDTLEYIKLADTLLDDLVDDIGVEATVRLLLDKCFDASFIEIELGFEGEVVDKVLEQIGEELQAQRTQQ